MPARVPRGVPGRRHGSGPRRPGTPLAQPEGDLSPQAGYTGDVSEPEEIPTGAGAPLPKDDLAALIEESDAAGLAAFLRLLHPADLAEVFAQTDPEVHWGRLVEALDDERLADALAEMEGAVQEELLAFLPRDRLSRLIGYMDSDDAADIIAELPEALRQRIVSRLEEDDAEAVETLLKYPEDTAGGIMQTELVSVRKDQTVADAIAEIRRKREDIGPTLYNVYVVDDENRLVGFLPLQTLILSDDTRRVEEVMEPARFFVTPDVDQEEVALIFAKYDLVTLAVVDEEGHLLGRIVIDDIVDVLEEEADEDLMRMVGAGEEDLVYSDRIFRISAYRLPWLIVTLFGSIGTGMVMWLFKSTLDRVLALVTFMPVITAMGGNVGTQSSTIMTRGFATGRVDTDNIRRVILKELIIGLTMGVACGSIVSGVAMLWHGDPLVGIVVGIAMVGAMTVATTIGTLAPAAMKRFGVDPAIASGPFVTTANDVIGILIYLGTATILLKVMR